MKRRPKEEGARPEADSIKIAVRRDGREIGVYRKEEVEQLLGSGELRKADLVTCEWIDYWLPLGSLVDKQDVSPEKESDTSEGDLFTTYPEGWLPVESSSQKSLPQPTRARGNPNTPKNHPVVDAIGGVSGVVGVMGVLIFLFSGGNDTAVELAKYMVVGCGIVTIFLHPFDKVGRAHREKKRKADEKEALRAKKIARNARQNPDRCPKCFHQEYETHYPSKPQLLAPASFTGALVSAAANSLADSIFAPERICLKCGFRWEAPNR